MTPDALSPRAPILAGAAFAPRENRTDEITGEARETTSPSCQIPVMTTRPIVVAIATRKGPERRRVSRVLPAGIASGKSAPSARLPGDAQLVECSGVPASSFAQDGR